jgi:hypothetical protein
MCTHAMSRLIATGGIAVAFLGTGAAAQERDVRAVARNLVQAAMLNVLFLVLFIISLLYLWNLRREEATLR